MAALTTHELFEILRTRYTELESAHTSRATTVHTLTEQLRACREDLVLTKEALRIAQRAVEREAARNDEAAWCLCDGTGTYTQRRRSDDGTIQERTVPCCAEPHVTPTQRASGGFVLSRPLRLKKGGKATYVVFDARETHGVTLDPYGESMRVDHAGVYDVSYTLTTDLPNELLAHFYACIHVNNESTYQGGERALSTVSSRYDAPGAAPALTLTLRAGDTLSLVLVHRLTTTTLFSDLLSIHWLLDGHLTIAQRS